MICNKCFIGHFAIAPRFKNNSTLDEDNRNMEDFEFSDIDPYMDHFYKNKRYGRRRENSIPRNAQTWKEI